MIAKTVQSVYQYLPWLNNAVLLLVIGWSLLRARRTSVTLQRYFPRMLWGIFFTHLIMLAVFATLLWLSVKHSTSARVYLPPYSTYYFDKIAQNVVTYLSGWIAAGLLFLGMWWIFVRRQQERMLDIQDVLLFALGAVAVGWPDIFVFLAMVFLLAVIWMVILVVAKKRSLQDRLVVTPVVIPAVVLTMVFARWILAVTHLEKIRF